MRDESNFVFNKKKKSDFAMIRLAGESLENLLFAESAANPTYTR